jgi:hypothetical protein
MLLTIWKNVHLVIERFQIQSAVSFWTVKIDNVTYKEFNNKLVYDSTRDKLLESNNKWIIILTK